MNGTADRLRIDPVRLGLLAALALGPAARAHAEEDGPLSIADLAAYRAALDPTPHDEPPVPSGFRDLWDRPGEFRGRRVAVGGRVGAVFHSAAVGTFPPLAETWVFTEASDPLCLVFPETKEAPAPIPGDLVRFEGTFLRRVRYRGGDADRLAPLVVGPAPPRVDRPATPAPAADPSSSPFDGVFVLVLGAIVALALVRAHLRRPPSRPIVQGPPPEFRDGSEA